MAFHPMHRISPKKKTEFSLSLFYQHMNEIYDICYNLAGNKEQHSLELKEKRSIMLDLLANGKIN